MENQRAIEIIQDGMAWANWTAEQKEAFIIAGEAVKKQIPIKVAIDDDTEFTCPTCGKTTEDYDVTTLKVCPECGQKLCWD
jgi:membrane protease subunit (stomatin/prohibitin family)